MSDEMLAHVHRVKDLSYTTLVIRGGHLYERYYPTFDRPDYTLIKKDLSYDEITFLENQRVRSF